MRNDGGKREEEIREGESGLSLTPACHAIATMLRECSSRVQQTSPASWQFELRNGKTVVAGAKLSGSWLRLSIPAYAALTTDGVWLMLAANTRVPLPAKFTLNSSRQPLVCADVRAIEEAASRQLVDACAALLAANTQLERAEAPEDCGTAGEASGEIDLLLDTLREAAWPEARVVDGVIEAAFECRGGRHEVRVAPEAAGMRFVVDLGDAPARESCSREAVARLLLSASAIRGPVRAVVRNSRERPRLGFEAVVPARSLPGHLEDAALGMMLACDSFGPEVRALSRPALAEAYLAMHSPGPGLVNGGSMVSDTIDPTSRGPAEPPNEQGGANALKRTRASMPARDSIKRFLLGG